MSKLSEWEWQDFEEVGSTNDIAMELSANPPAEKFVISARSQTNGRGRRGRSWIAFEENLFTSLGLKIMLQDLGQLIFVVSLSMAEAVMKLNPQNEVRLKWPNDVLVGGRKICGILLEKGDGDYIIVGMGVNIKAAPELPDLIYPATSLVEQGVVIDRISFLELYLQIFNLNYQEWQSQGFASIKKKWLQNVKGLGEEIIVNTGQVEKKGIFTGVDENGTLLLQRQGQVEKIYAGDVFYLK